MTPDFSHALRYSTEVAANVAISGVSFESQDASHAPVSKINAWGQAVFGVQPLRGPKGLQVEARLVEKEVKWFYAVCQRIFAWMRFGYFL